MGCFQSTTKPNETRLPKAPPNFGKKSHLNKQDYMFCQQESNVCIKPPGSINGEQFIIEDNKLCDIYLLDHIAALNVDNCIDCRIITGPVNGSIFLRDCKDCIAIIACQQLRLRNCHNMKILLFSTTGPIIESCSGIVFGCYNYNYFDLERNLTNTSNDATMENHRAVTTGLNCYINQWYDVYNFTPESGGFTTGSNENYTPITKLDDTIVYDQSIFEIHEPSNNNGNHHGNNNNTNTRNHNIKSKTSQHQRNWAYKLLAFNYNEYNDILLNLYKYNNNIQYILEEQLQIVNPIGNSVRPVLPVTCGIEQCYQLQQLKRASNIANNTKYVNNSPVYCGILIIPLKFEHLIYNAVFDKWLGTNTGDIRNAIMRTTIKTLTLLQYDTIEKLLNSPAETKMRSTNKFNLECVNQPVLFITCISNSNTMSNLVHNNTTTTNAPLNAPSTSNIHTNDVIHTSIEECVMNKHYMLITDKAKIDPLSKHLYETWRDKDQQ